MKKAQFTITAQPYGSKILCFIGHDKAAVLRVLKAKRYSKDMRDMVSECSFTGYASWFRVEFEKKVEHVFIIFMYKNILDLYDTLVHETNHMVYDIARHHGFLDECEAQAYLQESLFRELRTRL